VAEADQRKPGHDQIYLRFRPPSPRPRAPPNQCPKPQDKARKARSAEPGRSGDEPHEAGHCRPHRRSHPRGRPPAGSRFRASRR
jgi:hypothetical protein